MSIQAVAWALEQDLPARPKLVLVSIANHANHTDGYCWLKAETIAREAACTTRSIYRFIGGLVRNGYIRKAPRKGEDGKQRANDYWVTFDREEKDWDWGAHPEEDVAESDASEESPGNGGPQDVVVPHERISHGETPEPSDSQDTREPVEKHAVSCGPGDNRVSRYESLEPSKTKPEKDARAGAFAARVPRHYKPPPPQPMGAIENDRKAKMIFVYLGTPAWDAWVAQKTKERGHRWSLHTTAVIDGKSRQGWYFPSLFPPTKTGPPKDNLTAADVHELTK